MLSNHLPAKVYQFPEDYYLLPGFIDLHIHGANGYDVMDGSEAALIEISEALAAEGVTGFLATTMSAPQEKTQQVLAHIHALKNHTKGAALLGAHLEGPFIAKEKIGAQAEIAIALPDLAFMQSLISLAPETIKIVTLAPELTGALDLITYLVKKNIRVSIGHTNASYEETEIAIQAGCSHATHLFNAMRGLKQRDPGAVTALLLACEIKAELIADGLHLHPAILELVFRLKDKDHLFLVTDAMRAKCLGDGQYELGGQTVTVKDARASLEDGRLAGSTLRMPQAIKNMVQFSHCQLHEAIAMATINPAATLGLCHKGSIALGNDADLVVMNAEFAVQLTMREGLKVFSV
jgi:N-acetylglucosamine-6-phosphate deacetylase